MNRFYWFFFAFAAIVVLGLLQQCRSAKNGGNGNTVGYVTKIQPIAPKGATSSSTTWEDYIPDPTKLSRMPIRYIKVNFHFMQDGNGKGNFNEEEAREYVKNLMWCANAAMKDGNKKMNLPVGNNTPVLPPRYQYVLTPDPDKPGDDGIYVHQDEKLYAMVAKGKDRNNSDKAVIDKYVVQNGKIVNVFVHAHPRDSLKVPGFHIGSKGIALGTNVKIVGWYSEYFQKFGNTNDYTREWFTNKLLNHEIGHVLGLAHSWIKNDRCDDTPPHPNCWNVGGGNCRHASNNFMDYNTFSDSWTPCQIGRIQKNLSEKNSRQRKLLVKDWCHLKEEENRYITGSESWNGQHDSKGHIIIESGGELSILNRLSIPAKGKILVRRGGKLHIGPKAILENDCGINWDGIIVEEGKHQIIVEGTPTLRNMEHPIYLDTTSPANN